MQKLTETHVAYIVSLEKQGHQTAEEVLLDAKRTESPLHGLYDWNVKRAAEAHWLDRTRAILRLVKVVVHTETQTFKLPRYIRDPALPAKEQGYASVESLRIESVLGRRALIVEMERVTSSLKRARQIAIGLGLEEEVDDLLERVAGLRTVLAEETSVVASEGGGATASAPA